MAFTNKDVEQALACCSGKVDGDCSNCPFYEKVEDCEVELPERALKLIQHYKSKNEELKLELKIMRGAANSFKFEVNRLNLKIKELYREMARIAKYTVAESSHDKNDPRDRV